jgi:hypothetical protein
MVVDWTAKAQYVNAISGAILPAELRAVTSAGTVVAANGHRECQVPLR